MADQKELAYQDYLKGMKYKEIAEKYNVTINTVKSWKTRYKWSRDGVHTKEKSVHTKKKDANKKPQRKRSGNPNPENQFSHRNNPKLLHGLRSKFLHQEQIEIMEAMEGSSVVDQLWFQIEIKFSAIVRMQKIMWVEDSDDHLKEESGSSWGEGGGGESYKISFAYERYESYIKAQARAMAEYRNLVKQFLETTNFEDERRLKLEQMQLGIDKTKAEIARIKGDPEEEFEDDGFMDALNGKVDSVWEDENEE